MRRAVAGAPGTTVDPYDHRKILRALFRAIEIEHELLLARVGVNQIALDHRSWRNWRGILREASRRRHEQRRDSDACFLSGHIKITPI